MLSAKKVHFEGLIQLQFRQCDVSILNSSSLQYEDVPEIQDAFSKCMDKIRYTQLLLPFFLTFIAVSFKRRIKLNA